MQGDAARHFIMINSLQLHAMAFNRLSFLLNNCSVGSIAHSADFVSFSHCEETGNSVAEVFGSVAKGRFRIKIQSAESDIKFLFIHGFFRCSEAFAIRCLQ